ncbi:MULTISPECIES: hypothetical protein [Haloferax]|jgi:hypothetical protein|uniref:Uncharacterized protein n=6 Tax=Haloferax TaxID=2251 RepID=A0A384KX11_HALVD|nr:MULTISPECIES: hypothetical protein [Haloferax]ADE04594.1 uncharacterized protein HVO_1724 [Haloferax volcanii DS2]ELY35405.1 hypothetical protein C498_03974 [Haloferax volcanii DS2]ELZ74779.1 hypothetical protein C456_08396 [Haloferax lucentense DSM 14919]ELZ94389.1 hypothetical protein C452_02200 [Haloferax alexandrinus JCM 10717]MBC9986465.1 hypothetical protein [Haloferax sp. AS1]
MRALSRLWVRLGEVVFNRDDDGAWSLERSRSTETRWSRPGERVDCFRFDDGYVTTVHYEDREVTWQLTPGQVPLASALVMAKLYLEHELTPQTDPEGRPFVGLAERGPVQVFEEIPPEPVEYVYLDGVRTLEEFPEFLTVDDDFRAVFDRMAPARSSTSR